MPRLSLLTHSNHPYLREAAPRPRTVSPAYKDTIAMSLVRNLSLGDPSAWLPFLLQSVWGVLVACFDSSGQKAGKNSLMDCISVTLNRVWLWPLAALWNIPQNMHLSLAVAAMAAPSKFFQCVKEEEREDERAAAADWRRVFRFCRHHRSSVSSNLS